MEVIVSITIIILSWVYVIVNHNARIFEYIPHLRREMIYLVIIIMCIVCSAYLPTLTKIVEALAHIVANHPNVTMSQYTAMRYGSIYPIHVIHDRHFF